MHEFAVENKVPNAMPRHLLGFPRSWLPKQVFHPTPSSYMAVKYI